MSPFVLNSYEEMSEEAAQRVITFIQQAQDPVTLCFASGDTPLGMFDALIKAYKQGRVHFEKCSFIGLDDWVGLTHDDPGGGRFTMDHAFFNFVGVPKQRIHFFNAAASDLALEVEKINRVIDKQSGIDLAVLGIGRNGHLGFNEPGSPFDGKAHVVDLETGTQTVGQKYFDHEMTLNRGITIGLKQIAEAGQVLVLANGKSKAQAVKAMIDGPYSERCPASILQRHPNCQVLMDQEAAQLLEEK
ncbi:glucosamine-6-phosphate deaminase [Sporolactobacillus terrae]|uniref:glucosamine-6-phosphate deaminase n=1 Tax=Sporolactobacillus terrae TaxID=269673 RepID=UPI00048F5336|nr:glucosamine-6-phosphate deaminase [Sporolactobacillus terrae]